MCTSVLFFVIINLSAHFTAHTYKKKIKNTIWLRNKSSFVYTLFKINFIFNMDNNNSLEDLNVTLTENPPKKKRGRVNSLSMLNNTNDSLLVAIQAMESRLSTKIDSLHTCLDTKIDSLGTRLDAKIEKVEIDLTSKMLSLATSFEEKLKEKAFVTDINKLNLDVALLQTRQQQSETILDKIEREYLLNRLIISNVPYVEKENLMIICEKISTAIGSQVPIIGAHRLKTNIKPRQQISPVINSVNMNASTSISTKQHNDQSIEEKYPSIVIKFETTEQRFTFFHQYLALKNLNN